METQLLPINQASLAKAAALLRAGELVAMPTETVYGLAANAFSAEGAEKIFAAKGRPQDNPLIVHIAQMDQLPLVAADIPEEALALAEAFWPGPLTLILKRGKAVPEAVSAQLPTVGVRLPAHEGARALIQAAGFPLAAPSANLSGRPSPTTAGHVLEDLGGKIPLILDGGAAPVGVESTVLSLSEEPVVLRPGFVTAEEIAGVLGRPVRYSKTVTAPLAEGKSPRSPGTKYRHYAPSARLTLVQGGAEAFQRYVKENPAPGLWALCLAGEEKGLPVPALVYGRAGDAASQNAGLFAALRQLDAQGAQAAYARIETSDERFLAVYNRLLRAAAFRVVAL